MDKNYEELFGLELRFKLSFSQKRFLLINCIVMYYLCTLFPVLLCLLYIIARRQNSLDDVQSTLKVDDSNILLFHRKSEKVTTTAPTLPLWF